MPFCKNCGNEVNENAFVCLNCGSLVDENKQKPKSQSNDGTSMGIIGLCFALFIPFVTWIVSGIGYSQSNQADNKSGKTMNLIALVASSVAAVIYFIISIS